MVLKYIHTINGEVAGYDGKQIYYANIIQRKNGWHPTACDSLKQIKREQKLSKEWRELKGLYNDLKYGYVIIEVES